MLFDPKPKTRREDLYDREKELRELEKSLKISPLTVVTGIRRLGKTSLILVALRDKPSVMVDLRGIPQTREGLFRRIEFAMNEFFNKHKKIWKELKNRLKTVTGIQVFGSGISLSWGERNTDIIELFRSLEEFGVILAFDEVQSLRGPLGREFAEILAYLYDHSDLKIILSGSEVGLLYDFIGVKDPKAPLYGRYFKEIKLERFDEFKSKDFLIKGFEQVGMEVDEDVLDYAYQRLDGIVGWLVLFGLKSLEKSPSKDVVNDVLDNASRLVLDEFKKFLLKHKPAENRILEVAKAIAMNKKTWSEIKRHLESIERRSIPDSSLQRAIRALLKSSYIERVVEGRNVYYRITDPILRHALTPSS